MTRSEIHRANVDLSSIALAIVERLRNADKEAKQKRTVEVRLDDDLTTSGDARLLQIALENLLGNAWKFTRKRDGARIEIGKASKLFAAFQRLHNESEFEGTGIGLATVQRIVDRHGGRVWAEGVVGEGASFYFTLPVGESGS